MNVYRESVTKWNFNGFDIRIWREESTGEIESQVDLATAVKREAGADKATLFQIAENILKCPRVNAVEVLFAHDGVVVYKDWP